MIFYAFELLFACVNMLMAAWHKKLILENRPIVHWAWATLYVVLVIPFWFLTKNPILIICLFLVRELVFSPFLNLIRGYGYFYSNPKTNLHDRIEGKWQIVFYLIALLSFIILNIFP